MSSALVGKEFAGIHHVIAGVIYVLAGCACFLNHSRTLSMLSSTKLFSSKSRVVHLHFNVASIGAVAGFPLAASSCFAGKWIWGDWMCQAYAFEGFVFGVAVVQFVCLLMVDRFLATCQPDFYSSLSSGFVNFVCLVLWAMSAIWAALPLFGYGNYGREPQGTSCTIDWMAKNDMYYTYMTSLVMLAFVVPCTVSVFCYILTFDRPTVDKEKNDKEERLTAYEMNQIARLFFIVTFCAWSGYAVVSVWSLLSPITRVPLLLAYVPPIMAKLGLAFSPLIYSSVSPKCHAKKLGPVATELKKD